MKITILTNDWRYPELAAMLASIHLVDGEASCVGYGCYDDFIAELPGSHCDLVMIAQDGAEGMESVRAAKILLPEVPVIWFSDDRGFGPESYRLGCSYFSAAPVTQELLISAIRRCKPECLS